MEHLSGTLFDFSICPDYTHLKQRFDQINEQNFPVENSAKVTQWQDKDSVSEIDSNRLYEELVNHCDFDCGKHGRDILNEKLKEPKTRITESEQQETCSPSPKCEQDIENEKLKKETRRLIVDLEQCQDAGLPPVDDLEFSGSPVTMHHWQTFAKSARRGSSDTNVKTNFGCAAEAEILWNKNNVFTCSRVVDLCQVEPVLEKGSLEAIILSKSMEVYADKDVSEFESVLIENTVKEEKVEEKEQESHDLPHLEILQDAENCDCDRKTEHQTKGGIISLRPTLSAEAVSESPASVGMKDPVRRSAISPVKKTGIKRRHQKISTDRQHDWQKARNSAEKAQLYASNFFTMKTSHPQMKSSWYLYYELILPWLLPFKRPYSYTSEYLIFSRFFVDVCFGNCFIRKYM